MTDLVRVGALRKYAGRTLLKTAKGKYFPAARVEVTSAGGWAVGFGRFEVWYHPPYPWFKCRFFSPPNWLGYSLRLGRVTFAWLIPAPYTGTPHA